MQSVDQIANSSVNRWISHFLISISGLVSVRLPDECRIQNHWLTSAKIEFRLRCPTFFWAQYLINYRLSVYNWNVMYFFTDNCRDKSVKTLAYNQISNIVYAVSWWRKAFQYFEPELSISKLTCKLLHETKTNIPDF